MWPKIGIVQRRTRSGCLVAWASNFFYEGPLALSVQLLQFSSCRIAIPQPLTRTEQKAPDKGEVDGSLQAWVLGNGTSFMSPLWGLEFGGGC
jgi:hypothetical protein